VNGVLLQPLPYPNSDRIVPDHFKPPGTASEISFTEPNFADVKSAGPQFLGDG